MTKNSLFNKLKYLPNILPVKEQNIFKGLFSGFRQMTSNRQPPIFAAHGFAGFSPPQAGRWDRANWAVYTDFEADITENFTAGVAVRFEDFDDFGTTTNYKVSGRWGIRKRVPRSNI